MTNRVVPSCSTMYVSGKKKCFFAWRVSRKHRDRTYAHAEMTSCHKPPSSHSWISTWKCAAEAQVARLASDPPPRVENLVVGGCSFAGCENFGVLGAHVRYTGSFKKFASWYIVPACFACNRMHGMASQLKAGTILVKVVQGNVVCKHTILVGKIKDKVMENLSEKNKGKSFPKFKEWDATKKVAPCDLPVKVVPNKSVGNFVKSVLCCCCEAD